MAVTKKDVFTAIESLEQQGITATNAAILEITGGSNATVQKYRKEYYDSRQANAEKVTAINEKTALQAHYDKERKELQAEIQRLNEIAYTQKGRADLLEERLKQYETKPKQPKTTAVKE